MRSIKLLPSLLVLALGTLGLASCGSDTVDEPIVPAVQTFVISLENEQFVPDDIRVPEGSILRFENNDDEDHTVTNGTDPSDPEAGLDFDTLLHPGDVWEYVADDDEDIFCRFHWDHGMTATITLD